MKIAILGATGSVGSATLKEAVARGHEVIACARRPDAVTHLRSVTVVEGDLSDSKSLTAGLRGAEALVVAVTGPMRDTTFARRTTPVIVKAATDAEVDRIILVSAFGVGNTIDRASMPARLLYRTVLKRYFEDKTMSEQSLLKSELNWTIVYPVNLKQAEPNPEWTAVPLENVEKVPGLPTLPFSNLATTLVALASDPTPSRQQMVVTTVDGWRTR